jgi:hypothetical protein
MSHAQTDQNVKISLFFIEDHGLGNGAAHRFELPDIDLLFIFYADGLFRSPTCLADHGSYLKPLTFKDLCEGEGFLVQAAAEGDSQLFMAHLLCEFTNLLNPRFCRMQNIGFQAPVDVTFRFLDRSFMGKF